MKRTTASRCLAFEKLLADIRAILTPEQQAKLDGYIAAVKHRRNG